MEQGFVDGPAQEPDGLAAGIDSGGASTIPLAWRAPPPGQPGGRSGGNRVVDPGEHRLEAIEGRVEENEDVDI